MKRKLLRDIVGILLISVTLLSVGSLAIAEEKPVELDFWLLADSRTEALEKSLDAFKADMLRKHNIGLSYKWVTSQNLDEMFITATLARKGYDLAWEWQGATLNKRVASGSFMPLNKYFPKEEYGNYAGYNDLLIEGELYAMPFTPCPMGLVYHKGLFREAGIDPSPENFPKTWDDFLVICEKLKAAGITPFVFGNKGGLSNECIFTRWGSQPFDSVEEMREIVSKEGTWLHPDLIRFLHMYKDLYDKDYFMEGGMSYRFEEYYIDGLVADKAAMNIYGDFQIGYEAFKAARGEDIAGLAPFPIWADGKLNDAVPILSEVCGIAPWTKHLDEAVTVLKEFVSAEFQNKLFLEAGLVPTSSEIDLNLVKDPVAKDLLSRMQRNSATIWYGLYSHAEWQAQIRYMSLFLLGEVTAEEVFRQMDAAKEKI